MHTHVTPAQARTELARRGRDEMGRKTHKKSAHRQRRTHAQKTGAFKLDTKTLVRLAQAEQPTNEFVATGADWIPTEPSASASTGSICLDNSSARTLAHVA